MTVLSIQAGSRALAHLREHGLRACDIGVVPAAAGGPKGLIFQQLDKWLFGSWLLSAPRQRTLIGSSIGAWRMAAACHADPEAAFQRLGDLYCRQRYPAKPSPALVTDGCRHILVEFLRGHEKEITSHPYHHLHILASRGSRLLAAPRRRIAKMAGFGAAVLGNLVSRERLARHLERVVVGDARDSIAWLKPGFDAFHTHFAPLSGDNLEAALLASGTLPFVMEPVRAIAHAPAGTYWDGGLIDYHLALPYSRMDDGPQGGLVLYPHFEERIVPGWFDKSLPWRHTTFGRGWLDNVILVSPSRSFLQTLPRAKLPDRNDFAYYGLEHDVRILKWRQAMAEGERLRDALASFIGKPDLSMVRAL